MATGAEKPPQSGTGDHDVPRSDADADTEGHEVLDERSGAPTTLAVSTVMGRPVGAAAGRRLRYPGSVFLLPDAPPNHLQVAEMRVWERAFSAFDPAFSKADYHRAMDYADEHLASAAGQREVAWEVDRQAVLEARRELVAVVLRPAEAVLGWIGRALARWQS